MLRLELNIVNVNVERTDNQSSFMSAEYTYSTINFCSSQNRFTQGRLEKWKNSGSHFPGKNVQSWTSLRGEIYFQLRSRLVSNHVGVLWPGPVPRVRINMPGAAPVFVINFLSSTAVFLGVNLFNELSSDWVDYLSVRTSDGRNELIIPQLISS